MPIGPTFYGDVGFVYDEKPDPTSQNTNKVGGTVVYGTARSAMSPGDVVIVDTDNDDSYETTTSADQTTVAGVVVASLGVNRGQWDYSRTIASGDSILVRVGGVALVTASAAITRGSRVGTSTTAGRVATTTTDGASIGLALQAASAAGDQIRVLLRPS